jgi:hypothetical protein
MKRRMKMKIDISKRAVSAALAFMFVAAAIPSANAQQTDLRTFVVGTWRQPVRTMIGTTDVYETHLGADGTLRQFLFVNGYTTNPAWKAGTWEIKNGNELWFHITAAYPMYLQDIDHTPKPINAWEHLTIEVIDANHTRNPGGIATRIGR